MSKPGVYRSDVDGHLFVLNTEPALSVTCVVCMETCAVLDHKLSEFGKAAENFVNKHGALDEFIASSIAELVPPRQSK